MESDIDLTLDPTTKATLDETRLYLDLLSQKGTINRKMLDD
jgi:hypothetical protein